MSPQQQFDRAAQAAARRLAAVPRTRITCSIAELLTKAKEAKATAEGRYTANANQF